LQRDGAVIERGHALRREMLANPEAILAKFSD
jgi:hypothetical protein